jgi:diacylglycerol kinase (ATP)
MTNPRARGVHPASVAAVRDVLRRGGWRTDEHATRSVAEIRALSAEAARGGWDVVAVMGGDGTVVEAIGPLAGSGVPIAVIPAGTGNLLAGNLRIPTTPHTAASAILGGRTRTIDLGQASWAGGTRDFVVALGAGFDARVMGSTHPTRKRRLGKAAYFATAAALVPQLRDVPHRLVIDGVARELLAAEIFVANFGELVPKRIGPRRPVLPDDGLLDVIALTAGGRASGLLGVWEMLSATGTVERPGRGLFRTTAREVVVEAEPSQPFELDGDPRGNTPLRAWVLPGAVSIVVPR